MSTLAVPISLAPSALLSEAWRPGLGGVVSFLPRGTASDKGAWDNNNVDNNDTNNNNMGFIELMPCARHSGPAHEGRARSVLPTARRTPLHLTGIQD